MNFQTKSVITFLSLFFTVTSTLAYFSKGTYESGDSIQHFLIAKYAIVHPYLFLDHWGKPFFTLLACLPAQFGFFGICLFNIACATLTGWLSYRIAERLRFENAMLAPVFTLFIPIYYLTLISGLTEPLFALILIFGIFLTLSAKPIQSAVLISFLPFVRSEGYLLLPLFALAYFLPAGRHGFMLAKGPKTYPNPQTEARSKPLQPYSNLVKPLAASSLLLSATLLYSLIGYFTKHDLLWLSHENPYKGARELYGSGSLFYFLGKNEFILGTALVVLFLLGLFSYLLRRTLYSATEVLLIPVAFLVYFLAHSIFWWKGLFGFLGLIRVIAGVAPLAGLTALRGFNTLEFFLNQLLQKVSLLKNAQSIRLLIITVLLLFIIATPFLQQAYPRPLGTEEVIVKEASDWMTQAKILNPEIQTSPTYSYSYPYFSLFLNIDPFDHQRYIQPSTESLKTAPKGTLLLWDSHFSKNESKLPFSQISYDNCFQLIKSFRADSNKVNKFDIYIFQKKCS